MNRSDEPGDRAGLIAPEGGGRTDDLDGDLSGAARVDEYSSDAVASPPSARVVSVDAVIVPHGVR